MKKTIAFIFTLLVVLIQSATLFAGNDIVVQLRLYQGFNENGNSSGVIVSSYYLKKIGNDNTIIPFTDVKKETQNLIRIYKLKKIQQVAQLDVVLHRDKATKLGHPLTLNNRNLWITLSSNPEQRDRFEISIAERKKQSTLMASEIIVPEKKTAVLGFKDSDQKIYFLAFNRKNGDHKKKTLAEKLGAHSVEPPKLVYNVEPNYPKEAKEKNVSGEVVVKGFTDDTGRVKELKILEGHSLLRQATLTALKKWKYVPWKVDGVPKPVHFSMIFIFNLNKEKVEDAVIVKKYIPLIKANKPDSELPQIMEMILVKGNNQKETKDEKWKELALKLNAQHIEAPKLVRRIEPSFPDGRSFSKMGQLKSVHDVILHVKTDVSGRVNDITILDGPLKYRSHSIKAVRRWLYTPWKVDGVSKPVEFVVVIVYPQSHIAAHMISGVVSQVLEKRKEVIDTVKNQERIFPLLMEVVLVNKR